MADGDRVQNDPVGPVYVGPFWYDIWFEEGLTTRLTRAAGLCGPDTQVIFIDSGLGVEVTKETVLHELMHALWTQTELDRHYTDEDEERVIYSLSQRLFALFRDNATLVDYLMDGNDDDTDRDEHGRIVRKDDGGVPKAVPPIPGEAS